MLYWRLVCLFATGFIREAQGSQIESSHEALNPQLNNTITNLGGPTLFYNGSGNVPAYNETSPPPHPLPVLDQSEIKEAFFAEFEGIINGSVYDSNCTKCITFFEVMHLAAVTQSESVVTDLLIDACESINWIKAGISASTCHQEFSGIANTGPYLALLFRKMSLRTGDMEAYCHYKYSFCEEPGIIQIDESEYFGEKPANKSVAPPPSGEVLNVLHLSDWHLDPRPYRTNDDLHTTAANASWPASRFGNLYCDTPADLGLSLFKSMGDFVNISNISFSLFTGDVMSHDDKDQQSRAYVEYEETVTYETFKAHLGNIPIYATLGNHDTLPDNFATPYNLSESTEKDNFSWNYKLLASLWSELGWLDNSTASTVATHYGGYSYVTPQGLKIISINTDFWYTANPFNYYDFTNPDKSGILHFLAQELQASEALDQRAWIIGHVPSGYGGTGLNGKALPNPSALFYSIVRRFSPATIAGIFFGHLHYDQLMLYYDYGPSSGGGALRNTADVDRAAPLAWAHIAPSVTPLSGLNAGWTLYQVDARSFEVRGWQAYVANVSEANAWAEPEWRFEYDARDAYDVDGAWPRDAPLNATFWHGVTERMLEDGGALVQTYNLFETKSSVLTKNCSTAACVEQKVCYIRSGSTVLGDLCPQGNGPF